jgi:hypothetical protein
MGTGPKILDMIDFLQRQTAREPYTPYQETAPPLQDEEGGSTNLKKTNPESDPWHHFSTLRLAQADWILPPVYPSNLSH